MDHKFKVGDKVRVIADGSLVVIVETYYNEDEFDWWEKPMYEVEFLDIDASDAFSEAELEEIIDENDRIRKLSAEAWRYVHNYVGEDELPQIRRFEQKFSEMIVKECAELASCNAHVSGFALGDLIKEHFGVE